MKQLYSILYLDRDGTPREHCLTNYTPATYIARDISAAYGAATLVCDGWQEEYINGAFHAYSFEEEA